ncbi:MAG: group III truncated hemoglobin [Bacteroidota bacterium]|nr:group III truncated hemoglobin [Bacteroidota bacterium]
MKKDIINRNDIEKLVTEFYKKATADNVIGYIFNDVAKVNWDKHLPIMFDFWENALFFTGSYTGNPMKLHQKLHEHMTLTTAHFERWNSLFIATIDELFEGEKAELAKQRAYSISTVMQVKILHHALPITTVPPQAEE